ncbi:hypothetical protein TNIN_94151 [Trichonephila inaurata madagascariensis]|uniref:Uncharacterized protein n=1 Tax=Trichonephila inaurata madagascariensis TaxID=2747483 RepID=A0A8X6M8L2_9ARAC|nr:hypothetical protein TNIN_94151 [Trichonephila inaurata madagascariensis]
MFDLMRPLNPREETIKRRFRVEMKWKVGDHDSGQPWHLRKLSSLIVTLPTRQYRGGREGRESEIVTRTHDNADFCLF